MERYKRIFECDCTTCEKREACEKKKQMKESIKVCEACSCDINSDLDMDHGDQYEDNVETKTGDWESDDTNNDFTNGGEEFGDKPAEDDNWSESTERYKKIFEDNLDEECPGKPAGGGMCANTDNTKKLKGVCQNGWQWSSKDEKCYKVADTKK
jgi:hypothetical protein